MARYVFKFPDGTVKNLDEQPDPGTENPDYIHGRWVLEGKNSVNMEVFHLEFPPVKVTFRTDSNEVIYLSDRIPDESELPSIPEREGMIGCWDIPRNPFKDTVVEPTYDYITYEIMFNDCKGSRIVGFTIRDHPVFPKVRPKEGYVGRWDTDTYEFRNMVVNAVYEPVRITFLYDGKTEVQEYSNCVPPILLEKPGYIRHWEVPKEPGHSDIELSPVDTPIRYELTIRMGNERILSHFTMEQLPSMPKIPYRKGYVGYWTDLDITLPEDQETTLEYRPINMIFHCPDGTVVEHTYDGEDFEPPEFEGYVWPEYQISDRDIEITATAAVCFALFYVDRKLTFCVPYTVTDRHYLHEMFSRRTVPKLHRRYGRWSRMESPDPLTSMYYADYSSIEPDLPRQRTSVPWRLNEMADYIYDYGGIVELDGMQVNLLETDFSRYTGITGQNLRDLITLPFISWLEREGIRYENKVTGYTILEKRDGYQMKIDGGFRIGYEKRFDEALDFLQEYDIFFIKPMKSRKKVAGLPAWYLSMSVPYDDPDDEAEVWAELFPIDKMIPSMKRIETEYTTLKDNFELISITDEEMNAIEESNRKVIEVFNVTVHPECTFTVLEDGLSVRLDSYSSNQSEYEIPSKIRLSQDDSRTYSVKEIGDGAFADKTELKAVVIPDTVETIGESAFRGCTSLSSVLGGINIKTVRDSAFADCPLLKELKAESEDEDEDENTDVESDVQVDGHPSAMREFLNSLPECELDFLDAVCRGKDGEEVLAWHKKKRSMVILSINEHASDYLDCDELLDADGSVDEDYIDELKAEFGE